MKKIPSSTPQKETLNPLTFAVNTTILSESPPCKPIENDLINFINSYEFNKVSPSSSQQKTSEVIDLSVKKLFSSGSGTKFHPNLQQSPTQLIPTRLTQSWMWWFLFPTQGKV